MRNASLSRLTIAIAIFAMAAGATVPLVSPASATTKRPMVLASVRFHGAIRATSSTGQALSFQLVAERSYGKSRTTTVTLGLARRHDLESHEWSFATSTGAVHYNVGDAAGSVDVGQQIKPYGDVNITFQATAAGMSHSCDHDARETVTEPVSVTGTTELVTNSTGTTPWGTVGGDAATTGFTGHSHVTLDYGSAYGCEGSPSYPSCEASVAWNSPDGLSGGFVRHKGVRSGYLDATRIVTITSGAMTATREDDIAVTVPAPTFKGKGATARLVVHTESGSGVTGSATIVGADPERARDRCGASGQATDKGKFWIGSWTNGSTPLVVHEQIEGSLRDSSATTGAGVEHEHRA